MTKSLFDMWSYYGAKTNVIKHYPKPKHDKIIEPFAGTARYALRYFEKDILLVDKYDVIIKIWKWLQECSTNDILSLPIFKIGENINDVQYDCEAARFLVGFCCGYGSQTPRDIATMRVRDRPNHMLGNYKRIASNLFKIKHWKIVHGSYEDIDNELASWFIDAPYQFGGHCYKESNKKIDFNHLARWCMGRSGQVIVCENEKANWMDFKLIAYQDTLSGRTSESIWTNEKINPIAKQTQLYV